MQPFTKPLFKAELGTILRVLCSSRVGVVLKKVRRSSS